MQNVSVLYELSWMFESCLAVAAALGFHAGDGDWSQS